MKTKQVVIAVFLGFVIAAGIRWLKAPADTAPEETQAAAEAPTASGQSIEITLYTSAPAEIGKIMNDAFTKANPGISVNMYRSGTGSVMARVFAEARSGQIVPDVLHVADPAVFEDLKRRGWLQPHEPPQFKRLVELGVADPEGHYFVGRLLLPVLVWRATTADPGVETWFDLTKIANSDLGVPDPMRYGTILNLFFFTHEQAGDKAAQDFWLSLSKSGVRFGDWAVGLTATITGERKYGVTLDDQAERLRQRESIEILYPNPTPVVNAPMGLIGKGKNDAAKLAASRKFIDFWLGKEAQQILVDNHLLSPRDDVTYPEGRTPLSEINLGKINAAEMFEKREAMVEWWDDNM
ncbi:MAG: extracellular solute-binding protein [Lentisphaeria bacterium]|nr:extracellular solute-binding protein [Lentisphaeria bacterium]